MQIDFHHAVTYVAARIADFSHAESEVIAYAAQYVDDATSSGTVVFTNKAMYSRISSAHKAVDPRNMNDIQNHLVWIPFHFLPGNGGLPAGQSPEGSFVKKLVCHPDSPIAQDMIRQVIADKVSADGKERPDHLHRLGITMHVYADTWSHQGFAGVLHQVNEVDKARETSQTGVFKKLDSHLANLLDDLIPPLGHGRALVLPDMPFLAWQYKDGTGTVQKRDNTELFCKAADGMCRAMQRYRLADPEAEVPGIGDRDMAKLRNLFATLTVEDGNKRHAAWLKAIAQGDFSFGKAKPTYAEDGRDSWKAKAIGTHIDMPVYTYSDSFLTSDWKRFHDALQRHRITVLHDILPRYGICAA